MFYGLAKMREIRARRAMLAEVSVKCGSLPPDAGDLTGLGLHRIRPPWMLVACNYGLNAGRMAGGSTARRPAPVVGYTYTAKPYAN